MKRIKQYGDIVGNAPRRCIIVDIDSQPGGRQEILSRFAPEKRDSFTVAEGTPSQIVILVERP